MRINIDDLKLSDIFYQTYIFEGSEIFNYLRQKGLFRKKVELFPEIYAQMSPGCPILSTKKTSNVYVIFDVKNVRDYFAIEPKREKDTPYEAVEGQQMYVDPQSTSFRNLLGEGAACGGCPINKYFENIFDKSKSYYNDLADGYAARLTRQDPFFLRKCKNSACYRIYMKILDQGFIFYPLDMIIIEKFDDAVIVKEGKHRICAMKTYGYKERILAWVYNHKGRINRKYTSFRVINSKGVKAFYRDFKRWGILERDVRKYLTNEGMECIYSRPEIRIFADSKPDSLS